MGVRSSLRSLAKRISIRLRDSFHSVYKSVRWKLVLAIAVAVTLTLALIFFLVRRNRLEMKRIMVVSDRGFYDDVIAFQRRSVSGNLRKSGYRTVFKVISEQKLSGEEGDAEMEALIGEIREEDTPVLFLSPLMSQLFAEKSPGNFDPLHYWPIVVGMGGFVNTGMFDFQYRCDSSVYFKGLADYLREKGSSDGAAVRSGSCLFLYSGRHKGAAAYAASIPEGGEIVPVECDKSKLSVDDIVDRLSSASYLATAGFDNLYDVASVKKTGFAIIAPYYCRTGMPRNFISVMPDIGSMIRKSLDDYAGGTGCVSLDAPMLYRETATANKKGMKL